MSKIQPGPKKKPYSKPKLKAVRLEAGEAVLAACKANGQFNPSGQNCRQAGGCPTQTS